jgi:predicted ester cyclase
MMLQKNKTIVRNFFEFLERNLALPEDLLAPNIIYHVPGLPPLDLEAMHQRVAAYNTAFSDAHRSEEDLIAEGDRVAFLSTIEMTHTGEFMGIAATGKRVSFVEMGIFRIETGKIAEMWGLSDRMGLMQKLGVLPSPGS